MSNLVLAWAEEWRLQVHAEVYWGSLGCGDRALSYREAARCCRRYSEGSEVADLVKASDVDLVDTDDSRKENRVVLEGWSDVVSRVAASRKAQYWEGISRQKTESCRVVVTRPRASHVLVSLTYGAGPGNCVLAYTRIRNLHIALLTSSSSSRSCQKREKASSSRLRRATISSSLRLLASIMALIFRS